MAKITEIASDRVLDIASRIRAACGVLSEPADRLYAAQDAVTAASQDGNNTRLHVISEVAAMAHSEDWTHAEVSQACERAAKMGNAEDRSAKAVGVFISEMKTFASPKVRGHLPDIKAVCEKVWADETELLASVEREDRASVETPVRKWQSRFYHLVMAVARAVKEGKITAPMTDRELIDYAIANDPDHNETKIAARLKGIIDQIDAIHGDFGMEELKVAADYLRTISTKELLAARKALLASQKALEPPPAFAPPPADAAASTPVQPAQAASQGHTAAGGRADEEICEGAFDLDALLEQGRTQNAGHTSTMQLAALCFS